MEMSPERVEILATAVLEQVDEFYIEEPDLFELTVDGLRQVAEDHPPTQVEVETGAVIVLVGDTEVHRMDRGAQLDPRLLGQQTALALTRLRDSFPEEDAPDLVELSDSFAHGIANSLGLGGKYWPHRQRVAIEEQLPLGPGTVNASFKPSDDGWQVSSILSVGLLESDLISRGDTVLAVDGVPVQDADAAEFLARLWGPVDSPVTLTMLTEDESTAVPVTLRRELSGSNTVGAHNQGKTLRILVASLGRTTVKDLHAILDGSLGDDTKDYLGAVIDLRGNPGGFLPTSIEFADSFMADGRILSTTGRHPDSHQYFSAARDQKAKGLRLVVLTDEQTGSGAEIVAAALQDSRRAVVVGSTTFGLGAIRNVVPLPNAAALSLNWAEAITPSDYRLDQRGIMPTVCSGGDATTGEVLTALRAGRGIIDRATRTRDIDPKDAEAVESFRALCPPRGDGADISLEVATAILEEPGLYEQILALDDRSAQTAAH